MNELSKNSRETLTAARKVAPLEARVKEQEQLLSSMVSDLEGALGGGDQGGKVLKQLRRDLQSLQDQVNKQGGDLGVVGESSHKKVNPATRKALDEMEEKIDDLIATYKGDRLPPWFTLASTELERSLVLTEESLERTIGVVAEKHSNQVSEVQLQLKAEAKARHTVEMATQALGDDMEELSKVTSEQVAQVWTEIALPTVPKIG